MKIAQIVTYVSADGAFGGPVSVARAQCEELAARGHDVELLAGWDGVAELEIPGVTVRLFPVRRVAPGFSGLISPALYSYFRRHAAEYDAVHVHLARDLITLPVAHYATRLDLHVALQTHGMLMPDGRLRAKVFDFVATRSVLTRATAILALTEAEQAGLRKVVGAPIGHLARISNGIKARTVPPAPPTAAIPEVLFLARLHPRKRVMIFAEAARSLVARGVEAKFLVVGPDEGDLRDLTRYIEEHTLEGSLSYLGAVAPGRALDYLASASVYVLPSFGEVFPMTVLEAMSVGTPVIITSDCAIAPELDQRGAVVVTDGSADDLAESIHSLLTDATLRAAVIAAATTALSEWLSIEAVVDQLEGVYA